MSTSITWRNVNAPSGVAEAASLFQGAQRSFTGAFDVFNYKNRVLRSPTIFKDVLRRASAKNIFRQAHFFPMKKKNNF